MKLNYEINVGIECPCGSELDDDLATLGISKPQHSSNRRILVRSQVRRDRRGKTRSLRRRFSLRPWCGRCSGVTAIYR